MSSGFENENEIVNEFIRVLSFEQLNNNLQRLILKLNDNKIPSKFTAKKYGGSHKADLSLIIDDIEYNISVKKGSGNSIHQESVEDFIFFLKTKIEENNSVFDDIRFFIWGDGTIDGSGQIINRVNATSFKKMYPMKIINIQSYFNKHKERLTYRFLVEGAISKKRADFILFGDVNKCVIVNEKRIIEFVNSSIKKPISIGVLTFQAWNRNIEGRIDMENRRGQIQLKWGSIEHDLNFLQK
jgi:hypothetical protein